MISSCMNEMMNMRETERFYSELLSEAVQILSRKVNEITEEDSKRAENDLKMCTAAGDMNAAVMLVDMYRQGPLLNQDIEESIRLCEMAIQNADDYTASLACSSLGIIYTDQRNWGKAFHCFQKGTGLSDYACNYYLLGDMYRYGYGTEKNTEKAFQLYQEALSMHGMTNMNQFLKDEILARIGACWLYGIGTTMDLERAEDYLLDAREIAEMKAEDKLEDTRKLMAEIKRDIRCLEEKKNESGRQRKNQ